MNREETIQLLMTIQAFYPNFKVENKTITVNAWQMVLGECDYKQVEMSLAAFVKSDKKGFAPTPGQLYNIIHATNNPQQLNNLEAWSMVSKALRNSTYNSESEFAKLPPLVQKAVGTSKQLEIWATDENYNEEVVMSQFIRVYGTESARADNISRMPEQIQQRIAQVNENRMPQLPKPNVDLIEDATDREWQPMSEEAKKALEKLKGRMKSYESG